MIKKISVIIVLIALSICSKAQYSLNYGTINMGLNSSSTVTIKGTLKTNTLATGSITDSIMTSVNGVFMRVSPTLYNYLNGYGLGLSGRIFSVDTTLIISNPRFNTALALKQNSLGFTAENVANKSTTLTSPDNTKYPTTLAVSTALADKQNSTTYLGTIYKTDTWNNLSDFTNTTTASVSGNKILLSGGTNTTTARLAYNYYTSLERYAFTTRIRITSKTATSYGIGIGVASTGSVIQWSNYLKFDATNTGTSGLMYLYMGNNASPAATSTSSLNFSANDYIDLTLIREQDKFTCVVRNVTTGSTEISFTYNCPTLNTNNLLHNTGRFAYYNLGGTFTIDNINITGKEIKNAGLMLVGDSKTVGYNSSAFTRRFASQLANNFSSVSVSAGAGDGVQDVLDRISEIIALRPKTVLMCGIGRNDLATGASLSTVQTKYASIVTQLQAAGITVIHTTGFYETAFNLSPFASWITSTYTTSVIDTFTPLSTTAGTVSGDAVHLTDLADDIIYRTLITSPLLTGQNTIISDVVRNNNLFTLSGNVISPTSESANIHVGSTASNVAVANPSGQINLGTQFSNSTNNGLGAKLILLDVASAGNNYYIDVNGTQGILYHAGGANKHTFDGQIITNSNIALSGNISGTGTAAPTGTLVQSTAVGGGGWFSQNSSGQTAGFRMNGSSAASLPSLGLFGADTGVELVSNYGGATGGAVTLRQGGTASTHLLTLTGTSAGINTVTPNAASVFDLTSTTQGFLPPRMSTTQFGAIATKPAGLNAFDNVTNRLTVYDGTNVKQVAYTTDITSQVVNETAGTSATLTSTGRYIPQNASLTSYTLPATATVGDVIFINGKGAGGWKIVQSTGQQIHGATDTTIGASGFIASTARYNSIAIVCVVANTEWIIQSSQGSLTIN